jgi:hypothetical protein
MPEDPKGFWFLFVFFVHLSRVKLKLYFARLR